MGSNRRKSGFDRGLEVLAPLGIPVFRQMVEQQRGIVLVRGAAQTLREMFPGRREVPRAFNLLRMSMRYSHAVLLEGAYRHDLDGNPVEPISDQSREDARGAIGRFIRKKKAKREAAEAAIAANKLKLKREAKRSTLTLKPKAV